MDRVKLLNFGFIAFSEGLVKILILQVYSASHLYGRLLERKDESGKWVPIKSISHPCTIEMKMSQFFAEPSNR